MHHAGLSGEYSQKTAQPLQWFKLAEIRKFNKKSSIFIILRKSSMDLKNVNPFSYVHLWALPLKNIGVSLQQLNSTKRQLFCILLNHTVRAVQLKLIHEVVRISCVQYKPLKVRF